MKIKQRSIVGLISLCVGLTSGCFSSGTPVERSNEGRVQVTLSPIDLEQLSSDTEVLTRVLSMPFVELAERLPPFTFQCEAEMSFTQGARSFRQLDEHRYSEDLTQNFHATIRSAENKEVNVWLQDGDLLIRRDNGKIRRSPRRDIEIEKWGELALSPQSHTFELFYPYLMLEPRGDEEFEGRKVRRFSLKLNSTPTAVKESYHLPRSETRLAPVAAWREKAQPVDIDGFVLIDLEYKVVVQSSLRGRLKIDSGDEQGSNTELMVRFESTILNNPNEISTNGLSHVVDEVSRARPKKGNLGFYDPPTEPSK